jgi:hypothetical protein
MLKPGLKSLFVILIVFTTFTCIDPYYPELTGYKPLLVVEGLMTNENMSYIVKLSYTKQERDTISQKVSDATIYITDETGNNTQLTPFGNGIYKTDSLTFRGEIGKTYRLHITTPNGSEFESDSCTMLSVPQIDSIYFEKDVKLYNNKSVTREGISIFLDTKAGSVDKYFLRWEFDETWKFKVPFPKRFEYLNDTTILLLNVSDTREFCWKSARSSEIMTGAVLPGGSGSLKRQPVQFIASELSDRLTIRYSILVKQYSISQKEYEYWNNLKQINETEGDIFGSQPFSVLSNIKNINNSSEQVLGYFQVSAVEQKRRYISFDETIPLGIPFYHTTCKRIAKAPSDYQTPWGPPETFDDIYYMYLSIPGYAFIEPVYDQSGVLTKLVFTAAECSDCTLTGTEKKPDFWTDD